VSELAVAHPGRATSFICNPRLLAFFPAIDRMTKNRRSRTISFRLSPEEYESLRNLSESNGARSISEFTRSVACNSVAIKEPEKLETLQDLRSVIAALDRHVGRLEQILDKKEQQ
jgi:predicted DNA-binding protein